MKKTLALLLALMMAVCMFSACSKDEDNKSNPNEEKAVQGPEEVLNKYLECIIEGESLALNYTKHNTEGYFTSVEAINGPALFKEQLIEYTGAPEEYAEKVSEYFDGFTNKAYANASFEIESIEIEGDKATAEIVTVSPVARNVIEAYIEEMETGDAENVRKLLMAAESDENAAAFEFVKYFFDKTLARDSIYESNSATIELEKIDGEWLVVNIQ